MSSPVVDCPICSKPVREADINRHIDSGCVEFVNEPSPPSTQQNGGPPKSSQVASFFQTPAAKRTATASFTNAAVSSSQPVKGNASKASGSAPSSTQTPTPKRPFESESGPKDATDTDEFATPLPKKAKTAKLEKVAPLAERMRPRTLDEVHGQDLVGPGGVIRSLIETDRVPSMILWGGPGTGKTTIARLIAQTAGTRFVEINSTSTGVAECKKLFAEARSELTLTGRKTIIFCDEMHRFSKSQQDVFLAPVEAGTVTLIGATTENPSFKLAAALLSRCRTFTLAKLSTPDILAILQRALTLEPPSCPAALALLEADSHALLNYLSAFSDGDARTALNLLSLALDLALQPSMTATKLKSALTQTLVYDRASDQHYDSISALHKSIRGSDPNAALYYLARMLQSGEDALYIARRLVVIASEDVGLADNSLLALATSTYTAAEKIGMPECRIALAHCCVALAEAPKSVRAYRGLNAAFAALAEPGVAGLPVPMHLRNAPTRLMREMGCGRAYKYNPDYVGGRVAQEYLPEGLVGRRFLGDGHLGTEVDADLDLDLDLDLELEVDVKGEEGDMGKQDGSVTVAGERDGDDDGHLLLNPDGE